MEYVHYLAVCTNAAEMITDISCDDLCLLVGSPLHLILVLDTLNVASRSQLYDMTAVWHHNLGRGKSTLCTISLSLDEIMSTERVVVPPKIIAAQRRTAFFMLTSAPLNRSLRATSVCLEI